MTDRTFEINKNLMCFLLVLVILCAVFMPVQGVAFAVEESGSNVLVDLNKAENFNVDDYPYNPTDNSLHVIHVAESTDKELLVYVYQPSGEEANIKASSINITTAEDNVSDIMNKPLEFLNSDGVFYKYKINDFAVSDDEIRLYTIVSIFRPFIEGADEEAGFDNTISEVPYPVAKEFTFRTSSDGYEMEVLDVITIVEKFVGLVRYSGGIYPSYPSFSTSEYFDSHFVAFTTDIPIDKLLEADLYYVSQDWRVDGKTNLSGKEYTTSFGKAVEQYVSLTFGDQLKHKGTGAFAPTIVRDRIRTVEQFLTDENVREYVYTSAVVDVSYSSKITEEGIAALQGKQWVLSFADTEYSLVSQNSGLSSIEMGTSVSDVTILRLKFVTDDETYNLGVVDNKQTGSGNPINDFEYDVDFKLPSWLDGLKDIAKLILLIVFIIFMLPVVYVVLKYSWKGFKGVVKSISKAAKKNKEKKRKKKKNK